MVRRLWLRRSLVVSATVVGLGVAVVAARPAAVVNIAAALASSPNTANSQPQDVAAEKDAERQKAIDFARAAPRDPKVPATPIPESSLPPETWASGIQDIRQPPEPGFEQVNEWDGQINGGNAIVHAGCITRDGAPAPQAPGEVVITTDPRTNFTITDYPDPGTTGPFTITSVQYPRVVLQDATGAMTSFDVLTHAFGG